MSKPEMKPLNQGIGDTALDGSDEILDTLLAAVVKLAAARNEQPINQFDLWIVPLEGGKIVGNGHPRKKVHEDYPIEPWSFVIWHNGWIVADFNPVGGMVANGFGINMPFVVGLLEKATEEASTNEA